MRRTGRLRLRRMRRRHGRWGPGAIPIIDAHIHLFDQTRPVFSGYTGGLFYRQVNKPSTPAAYAALARPTGIVGAIVVESAAQYIDDNLYYLEISRDNPIMVGVSGNIDPGSAEFAKYLNHFHRDPLFRAIRSSRFYSRDASGKVALNPTQVANLKLLAQADLALDTANPSMDLMNANVLLADAVPDLRIIMDHLPSFDPTPDGQAAYEEVIKEMAARPNIFVKLTEVYHPKPGDGGIIVKNYEFLRARLEYLFDAFGEDRVHVRHGLSQQLWRGHHLRGGRPDAAVLLDEAARAAGEVFLAELVEDLQVGEAGG